MMSSPKPVTTATLRSFLTWQETVTSIVYVFLTVPTLNICRTNSFHFRCIFNITDNHRLFIVNGCRGFTTTIVKLSRQFRTPVRFIDLINISTPLLDTCKRLNIS